MKAKFITLFWLICFLSNANAQIVEGLDTLLGNEWIKFDQTYFKIKVGKDGFYRIPQQAMANAGLPLGQVNGNQWQVWHNGHEVPIYTTTNGSFGANDFVAFWGKANTSELDRHLFVEPESNMMNPHYSLVTDTSAYFLTWNASTNNLRFETIANDLNNLPPKEEYYTATLLNNSFDVVKKWASGQSISTSDYSQGEGFTADYANVRVITLSPTSIFSGGQAPKVAFRYSGNYGQHQQIISLNDQTLFTSEFFGFEVQRDTMDLLNSQLAPSMKFKFQGAFSTSDFNRVANILLWYPRQFDFDSLASFPFNIDAASNKKYLEIDDFNVWDGQPVLFDITNQKRIVGQVDGQLVKLALPASPQERSLWLVNDEVGYIDVDALLPISFTNYSDSNKDYILLTSTKLLDDGTGNNWVQEYANYRASQIGGGFDPVIVEVESIYDQFGWGIERHPLAIRNFALYVKKHWEDPRYFLIIGKGREYPDLRTQAKLATANNLGFCIPTYSFPGSDNLLLAGQDGVTPVLSIGRIAATSPSEVKLYLDKVKEFEANRDLPQNIADRLWMKNVLHMGGGLTPGEQSSVKSYLAQMESIIEQSKFGADVKSFYKTSTDPIQVSQTDQIFSFINQGTSIISFFGHSAVGTFDFSIDNPDNFENKGKYPMMISLGCYSGNIHTAQKGISERFCLYKDKGSIAFGATSGQGFAGSLSVFANEFYKNVGQEMYGQGIGDAIRNVIASLQSSDFGVNLIRQQFNLHGDPALRLNPAPGPDFLVDESKVSFNPPNITTQLTDFDLSFDVVNLGSGVEDSILITIIHELPDGFKINAKEMLVPAPKLRESFTCNLPTLGELSKGFNRFYITVDKSSRVAELPAAVAESNNDLTINGAPGIGIYFSDNSVEAIYPPEFAIMGKAGFELKATTSEPLVPERAYIFQLDTTELFNSPFLMTHKISQKGGIIRWKPNVNYQDSVVYYWRVSPDSNSANELLIWDNSSFVFLSNIANGWNQSHFYQWKKDEFVDMELKTNGNLKFIDNFKDVFVRNAVNNDVEKIEIQMNNAYKGRFWHNMDAGIYVYVFDSTSATEWLNAPPYPYGENPSNFTVPSFCFKTQTLAERQELIDFLTNVVPTKDFVVMHTAQKYLSSSYEPEEWESDQASLGTDLFQVLEAQGAALIRNTLTTGSIPYVFAYQKDTGPIKEVMADSLKQVLRVNISIPGYWDRGALLSTPIGPAKTWNKLHWALEPASNPETDTVALELLAYNPVTLTDSLLASAILPGEFDLSTVNASDFPYLKLRYLVKDSILRTAPQLDYWRVMYEGVPDFAVNPSGGYFFNGENLEEGDPLQFHCMVENLSDFEGDSLTVKFTVRSEDNAENMLLKKEAKLAAHDTLTTFFGIDTKALSGKYSLVMELNPSNEQPEFTHTNNILSTGFSIQKDLRNPLLDVTFDGMHILDGDIVSSRPTIKISLKDENPFLPLNDTNLIRIFLVFPDSQETQHRIYFNEPQLVFYPATTGVDNKASIEYQPIFTMDGEYQLIVQARDVSGNLSGQFDYKTAFKIITKSSISNFLNYPNPFTTSTRFVYTMTGAEPPARYKLQIMTVSGQIVRELNQDDLGPLRVGTHQTDFAWDGTDQFGDRLAKGVYLYRMLVQDANGENWEGFETGADKYFSKGFGKMVLLR